MLENFKFCIKFFKGDRARLFFSTFLKILNTFILIIIPLVYSEIINCVVDDSITDIPMLLIKLGAAYTTSIFLKYFFKRIDITIAKNVNFRTRVKTASMLLQLPNSELTDYTQGSIFSLIMSDSQVVSEYATTIINSILTIINIITIGVVSFLINWKLSLILLCTYPISYFINWLYAKKIKKSSKKLILIRDDFISYLKSIATDMVDIKIQDGYKKIIDQFIVKSENYRDQNVNQATLQINNTTIINVISFINYMLITCVGILFVILKEIMLGEFVAFNTYSKNLSSSLDSIVQLRANLQPVIVSLERLSTIEKMYQLTEESNKDKKDMTNIEKIELCEIDLDLNGKRILSNISCLFKKGEIVGLTGNNGSGKTSITNIILKRYLPSSGKMKINDIESKIYKNNGWSTKFSYIGANKILYNLSIIDNLLLFSDETVNITKVKQICELVNLHEDIQKMPDGYNTLLSDNYKLSSGQIQKLQIARTFLKDSDVMIFDEAFSNLEPSTKENVIEYIKNLSNDKIIIITSHNIEDYDCCKKIYKINNGNLIKNT